MKFSIFALFLLINLVVSQAAEEPSTPLRIDQHLSSYRKVQDPPVFYEYTHNKTEFSGDEDLTILVNPLDSRSDPDIFVSTKISNPQSKADADFYDQSFGYNVVIIPNSLLEDGKTYFIGVKCSVLSTACEYMIHLQKTQNFSMMIDQKMRLVFQKHSSEIVRIYVPPFFDNAIPDRLILSVQLMNADDVDTPLQVLFNKGSEPPTPGNHSELESGTSWLDGRAVVIPKSSPSFCQACNYTLLITAGKGAKVIVEGRFHKPLTELSEHETWYDVAPSNQNVHYVIDGSNIENFLSRDLVIYVVPFEGFASLAAHPIERPQSLSEYKWKANLEGGEVIVITAMEKREAFKNVTMDKHQIYITVQPFRTTVYSISFKDRAETLKILTLGVPAIGYVLQNQVLSYILAVEAPTARKLTIYLSATSGNPDLIVRSCENKDTCRFDDLEYNNLRAGVFEAYQNARIFQVSNQKIGDDSIELRLDRKDCSVHMDTSSTSLPSVCLFAVGIINNGSAARAHYSIAASFTSQHTLLQASKPTRGHVSKDEYRYYIYSLFSADDVAAVKFQVTPISGEVNIFVSKSTRHPYLSNCDLGSLYGDFVYFKRNEPFPNLAGTYYIAVYGFSAASYSILTELEYIGSGTEEKRDVITLYEGMPQKITIDKDAPKFFKFTVPDSFYIYLQRQYTHFDIFLSNQGNLPTPKNNQYNAIDADYIYVDFRQQNFQSGEYFLAGVYPKAFPVETREIFTIVYVTEKNFAEMQDGKSYTLTLDPERRFYFRIRLNAEFLRLKISIDDPQDKLIVYGVASNSLVIPDDTNYNFTMEKESNQHMLEITKSDVEKSCLMLEKCVVYLRFSAPHSVWGTKATISLSINDGATQLVDSQVARAGLTNDSAVVKFYYEVTQMKDLEIVAHSYFKYLAIFVNVISSSGLPPIKSQWNWPTDTKADLSFIPLVNQKLYQHTIKADLFNDCKNKTTSKLNCLVLISVYDATSYVVGVLRESGKTVPFHSNPKMIARVASTFTIMVTSDLIPLQIGQPVIGSVAEKQYRYYLFTNKADDVKLTFVLTPLDNGNPDLVIDAGEHTRPMAAGKNKFSATADKSDFISFGKDDIAPLTTMAGNWVVGVYGETASKYTLTVIEGTQKIAKIYPGVPQQVVSTSDETYYFHFLSYEDSFDIIVSEEYGNADLFVMSYQPHENMLDALPSFANYHWSSTEQSIRDVIQISSKNNQSGKFCTACNYIIAVTCLANTRATLAIRIPGEFVYLTIGKPIKFYTDTKDRALFHVLTDSAEKIYINMMVFTGTPKVYVGNHSTVSSENYSCAGYPTFGDYNSTDPEQRLYTLPCNLNLPGEKAGFGNVYFIAVEGEELTSFEIMISQKGGNISVADGVTRYLFLNNHSWNQLLFYQYHKNTNGLIKIDIKEYWDPFIRASYLKQSLETPGGKQKNNILQISTYNMQVDLVNLTDKTKRSINVSRTDLAERGLENNVKRHSTYLLEPEEGLYLFNLSNPFPMSINLSITISSHEKYFIPTGTSHLSRLEVGREEIYELFISKDSLAAIEIFECFGSVEVGVTQDKIEAGKGNFEHTPRKEQNGWVGITYPVKLGSLFIRIHAVDGMNDRTKEISFREALFKLKVSLYPAAEPYPANLFWLGKGGLVLWNRTSPERVTLNIPEVGFDYSGHKDFFQKYNMSITYEIYVGDDPKVVKVASLCALRPNMDGEFEGRGSSHVRLTPNAIWLNTGNVESFQIPNLNYQNSSIWINTTRSHQYAMIIAKVRGYQHKNQIWGFPLIYDTTEIPIGDFIVTKEKRSNLYTWMGVISFLSLAGLLVIVKLIQKYNATSSRLQYELQTVRNEVLPIRERATAEDEDDESRQRLGD